MPKFKIDYDSSSTINISPFQVEGDDFVLNSKESITDNLERERGVIEKF